MRAKNISLGISQNRGSKRRTHAPVPVQRFDIHHFYGHNQSDGHSYSEIPDSSMPRFDFQNKLKYKSQAMS
jgi:hypothetical protein